MKIYKKNRRIFGEFQGDKMHFSLILFEKEKFPFPPFFDNEVRERENWRHMFSRKKKEMRKVASFFVDPGEGERESSDK